MKRIAVAFAAVLVLAAGAGAQQRRGPDSRPLADYLGLTGEQKAAWETIQMSEHETGRALHEQERALANQLESATDAATIGNLVLQLRAIQTQLDAAHDATKTKFAALLTADQQVKFAAFEAAAAFLRQRGPGGPYGPPPPPRR